MTASTTSTTRTTTSLTSSYSSTTIKTTTTTTGIVSCRWHWHHSLQGDFRVLATSIRLLLQRRRWRKRSCCMFVVVVPICCCTLLTWIRQLLHIWRRLLLHSNLYIWICIMILFLSFHIFETNQNNISNNKTTTTQESFNSGYIPLNVLLVWSGRDPLLFDMMKPGLFACCCCFWYCVCFFNNCRRYCYCPSCCCSFFNYYCYSECYMFRFLLSCSCIYFLFWPGLLFFVCVW